MAGADGRGKRIASRTCGSDPQNHTTKFVRHTPSPVGCGPSTRFSVEQVIQERYDVVSIRGACASKGEWMGEGRERERERGHAVEESYA